MTKKADIGSKRLISLSTQKWLQWVTQIPTIQAREIIDSEFQWISRESDVIIRAYSPQDGEFLVLNELQLHYSSKMPRQMLAYTGLAEMFPFERVFLCHQSGAIENNSISQPLYTTGQGLIFATKPLSKRLLT